MSVNSLLLDAPPGSVDLDAGRKDPAGEPLTAYLQEIGRVPLLTSAQEVALAQAVEAGRAAEQDLQQLPAGATEERGRLGALVREAARARQCLVEANLRLVVSVARRYAGRGVALADLVQEGNIGLLRAVEKFDWRRGFRFSTYATWWIRQAVSRAVADDARSIRLPVHVVEALNKLSRALGQLQQRYGREPTPAEIGAHLDLPAERVAQLLNMLPQPLSLESPPGGEQEALLSDFIRDEASPSVEETVSRTLLREHLEKVLDTLTPRERLVLRLRFGLEGDEDRSLAQVGAVLGVTRERVRQIESLALRKLRAPSRAQPLQAFAS